MKNYDVKGMFTKIVKVENQTIIDVKQLANSKEVMWNEYKLTLWDYQEWRMASKRNYIEIGKTQIILYCNGFYFYSSVPWCLMLITVCYLEDSTFYLLSETSKYVSNLTYALCPMLTMLVFCSSCNCLSVYLKF